MCSSSTIDPSGLTFQTDPSGTILLLWWFEDDSRIVITSEVKSLIALQAVQVELNDIALQKLRHPPTSAPSNAFGARTRTQSFVFRRRRS